MTTIHNLKPRNDYFITSQYNIINPLKNDFNLVIYFIRSDKIKIILRKLNDCLGWNHSIKIKIFNDTLDKYEIINIGTSNKNFKICNTFLNHIQIKKKKYKSLKIPKIIFQTSKSNTFDNILALNSIYSFQELNPNFEYLFFDNPSCRLFIEKNFDKKYLEYYDIIYPGAFKADYFRYCFMYIHGGFYFDCKNILLKSLESIVDENDELILCQDHHATGLYNAVMMSSSKQIIFKDILDRIIYKINNFQSIYGKMNKFQFEKLETFLSLTGPNMLYEEFINQNLKYNKHILMKHKILGDYRNYKNLVVEFNNDLLLYKNYSNYKAPDSHYSKLWKSGKIFNSNIQCLNQYKFYISPEHQLNFTFEFYIIYDFILILQKNNKKWNNNFIFNIILDNHTEINCFVPVELIQNNYAFLNYKNLNLNINLKDEQLIDFNILNSKKIDNYHYSINLINNKYIFILINKTLNKLPYCQISFKFKNKFIEFETPKNLDNHFFIKNIIS